MKHNYLNKQTQNMKMLWKKQFGQQTKKIKFILNDNLEKPLKRWFEDDKSKRALCGPIIFRKSRQFASSRYRDFKVHNE